MNQGEEAERRFLNQIRAESAARKPMPPRERGSVSRAERSKKPEFVETIDGTNDTIGMLEDGSWVARWRLTPAEPGEKGKISWRKSDDVWGVLDSHKIVVLNFLGSADPYSTDPYSKLSITQILPVMLPGENEFIRLLSNKIQEASTKAVAGSLTQEQARDTLEDIRKSLSRVRNPYKVKAKQAAERSLTSGQEISVADLMDVDLHLVKRIAEGTTLPAALIERGSHVLKWTRDQETKLNPLTITLSQAITTAREGRIDPEWDTLFFLNDGQFHEHEDVKGLPFKGVMTKELERLRSRRDLIMNDPIIALREFGIAYGPLMRIHNAQRNRDITGEYNIFKTNKQIANDVSNAEFETQNPRFQPLVN